jgi:O-methyltransferase
VNLHRGWFKDTFPSVEIAPVALVHVDCDFYEPTKLCLDKWYPALSPGGFMQFDDYSEFIGCKRAVDEFLATHPELTLQKSGEGGAAYYLRKPN